MIIQYAIIFIQLIMCKDLNKINIKLFISVAIFSRAINELCWKVKEYIEQAMNNMGYYESFEGKKQANQAYKYLYNVNSYNFDRLRNSHIGTSIVKYQLCRNIFG